MREIKFRIWHDHQGMIYPDNKFHIIAPPYILKLDPQIKDNRYFIMPLSDFDIMQYTGLKDKNGKEIYEGDLLNEIRYPPDKNGNYDSVPVFIKENIVQVGFSEGCFTADEAHLWRFISNIGDNEKTDYEIIGNIYENPELLTLTK